MTLPPNPAKNQHYVPQFYLRRWVPRGGRKLWCCRVESRRVVHGQVHPRSTASEPDLYRVSTGVSFDRIPPRDLIEKGVMNRVDNDGASALAALTSAGPEGPSEPERRAWARFLVAANERDAHRLRESDDLATMAAHNVLMEMREQFGRTDEDLARLERALRHIDCREAGRGVVRASMVQEIRGDETVEALLRMSWYIVRAPFGLITSDRPLLVNAGLFPPPQQFASMALDPTTLFFMTVGGPSTHESALEMEEFMSTLAVAHNFLLLRARPRYVYSQAELQDVGGYKLRSFVEQELLRREDNGSAQSGAAHT